MFDEITRLLNHLMSLGSHALDVGAMAVFLYAFREREDLMDCYEAVSGAHARYYRPGGVYRDLPDSMPQYGDTSKYRGDKEVRAMNDARSGSLLDFIEDFTNRFPGCVDEYETLLTDNRIWKQRLVGIGVVDPDRAKALGFTGPMLRGSGVAWDLRKTQPTKSTICSISTSRGRERRLLRPLPGPRGRNAPEQPHHPPVRGMAAQQQARS